MSNVKPWEPVTWSWIVRGKPGGPVFQNARDPICTYMKMECSREKPWSAFITLANGQRIIVRALSEECKVARRARQEAK